MLISFLAALAAGAGLAAVSLWLYARHAAKWGIVAASSEDRHLHQGRIVSGAGVAFLWPTVVLLVLFPPVISNVPQWHSLWLAASMGLFLLVATGFIDDRHHLPARWRLLVQVVSTGFFLWLAYSFLQASGYGSFWVLLIFLGTLWWLNLFNFMDGANGMAGWHALLALGFYALAFACHGHSELALLAEFVAAAVAVFLYWNFPRARLFMGDAGSLGLAWLIAVLAIFGLLSGAVNPAFVFVLHSAFILDATLTLLHRWRRGKPLTQAHREHLYQQLIASGHSHSRVALAYALATLASGALAWLTLDGNDALRWAVLIGWPVSLMAVWLLLRRSTKNYGCA